MQINGGVRFCEQGVKSSIRAMHLQTTLLGMVNENIVGYDKIGYQRKVPVVSSFTEYLGTHGLSSTIDDQVGRIMVSKNPLDVAMANKGYFQVQTNDGVKLTRDGRFHIDKFGYLLNLEDQQVLSDAGMPIKFSNPPEKPENVVIDSKGKITVFDKNVNKMVEVGHLGIVDTNGMAVLTPDIKQGYNEHSNVIFHNEIYALKPIIRNFDANREIFLIESQNLSKVISQLGGGN